MVEVAAAIALALLVGAVIGFMELMLLRKPSLRDKAPAKKETQPMRTYDINVTWDDIRRGKRGDVAMCPTGLAMERAGAAGVYFPIEALPEVAQDFIRDFDNGLPVQPIHFIMDDYRQEAEARPAEVARGQIGVPGYGGRYPVPAARPLRDPKFEPVIRRDDYRRW
jgi:hypothetical protein